MHLETPMNFFNRIFKNKRKNEENKIIEGLEEKEIKEKKISKKSESFVGFTCEWERIADLPEANVK